MADIVIQLLPHIAAALLYGALGFHFWSTRWREQENQCVACPMQVWERVAIASALLIHAYGLYGALFTEAGMRFSFSFALSTPCDSGVASTHFAPGKIVASAA